MILYPAIDLYNGKAVRLFRGDYGQMTVYSPHPEALAEAFRAAGATHMHLVDLEGAKAGSPQNLPLMQRLIKAFGGFTQIGGGIRSMEDLKAVFDLGVTRAVIGSAAVSNPELVAQAIATYGADRIAVGIDARDGKVKTAGWEVDSGIDYLDFAKQMERLGVKIIIFTDIETDGMLSGPSFGRLQQLQKAVSCQLIASGGVSCNQDIVDLERLGVYGAIIGKAYYAGAIDLAQAVKDGGAQC